VQREHDGTSRRQHRVRHAMPDAVSPSAVTNPASCAKVEAARVVAVPISLSLEATQSFL